jgi:hypothetical protein
VIAPAQSLSWSDDLDTARQAAMESKQPLLLLFTSRESSFAARVEESLSAPSIHALLQQLTLVRLDIAEHQKLASDLGVFRAGTMMLFRSDGTGIARIGEAETPDQIKDQTTAALDSAGIKVSLPPGVTESTPAIAPPVSKTPAPPAIPLSTEYIQLPKGPQVGESVTRNANDPTTVTLGVLKKNKNYVLQVKGAFGTKRTAVGGSDALYNFMAPEIKDKPTTCTFVRFTDGNIYLPAYFRKRNLPMPPCNTTHTYDVPIKGEGKELTLFFREKNERNYSDNTGSVTFTLFEGSASSGQ